MNKGWLASIGSILMAFLATLGINIIATSSELIQARFGASINEISTVSSAYLISEIIAIPTIALFIKRFNIERVAIISSLGFGIASFGCANAWNIDVLIFFRCIQGLFGGVSISLAYTMIKLSLEENDQPTAMGFFSITSSLAPVLAPSLIWFLPENVGYEILFYINIPFCLASVFLIRKGLKGKEKGSELNFNINKEHIYYALVAGLSFGLFVYSLEYGLEKNWMESSLIRLAIFTGILGITYFCITQWLSEDPLLNIKLFRNFDFSIICLAGFLIGLGVYGVIYLLPYYLIAVHNYTPSQISLVVLMAAIPQLILMPMVIKLTRKYDGYLISGIGAALFAATCLYNSNLTFDFAGNEFHLSQIMRAISLPLVVIPMGLLVIKTASKSDAASASVLYNLSRTLGGAVGIAFFITMVSQKSSEEYQNSLLFLSESSLSYLDIYDTPLSEAISIIETQSMIDGFNFSFLFLSLLFFLFSFIFILKWVYQGANKNPCFNAKMM